MVFSEKDKAFHKGLIKLLDEGTFQLKAREVQAFALIYKWVIELDKPQENVLPKVKKK